MSTGKGSLDTPSQENHLAIDVHKSSVYCSSKGSSLITFDKLYYYVDAKVKKAALSTLPLGADTAKMILNGVSGVFHPGRMTAIMGASGAGKTTLMNAIADRLQGGYLHGDILVNGKPVEPHLMRKISGFVHQEDTIMSTMTPREAISMSARLRLPEQTSAEDRKGRVDDILELMDLNKVADAMVGSVLVQGISGGEKKRAAIAMEMVTNPPILFLDEPTSGLDTFTAYRVVKSLADLAKQNRTIVCTIHQPSSEIFYLFDDLVLICRGDIVYHGPVNEVVSYFSAHGYSCPTYTNPADYLFMAVLRDFSGTPHAESAQLPRSEEKVDAGENVQDRLDALALEWRESAGHAKVQAIIEQISSQPVGVVLSSMKVKSKLSTQLQVLRGRAYRNMVRNKFALHIRLFQSIFFGLLIGLIYLNVDARGPDAQIQDRLGALYFMTVNMFMASMMATLTTFFEEKAVFQREYAAGYYSLFGYFFSKVLIELPFQLFYPFLTVLICYFMIGLQRTFYHFIICCIVNIISANTGVSLGLACSAAFPHLGAAMGLTPLIFIPMMILGGFFVNSKDVPVFFVWLKWISPMKYSFAALSINEFQDALLPKCPGGHPCSGNAVLEQYGSVDAFSLYGDILMQLLFYFLLLALSYVALSRVTRTSKPSKVASVTIKPQDHPPSDAALKE